MRKFDSNSELKSKKNDNLKIVISMMVVIVAVIIGYSFATFTTHPQDLQIISNQVGKFSIGDINLSVVVDGEKSNSFPSRDSGYVYAKTDCDNGSTATWDNSDWSLNLKAKGPDKCTVYFGKVASTMISELAKTNTITMNTDDPDHNPRYMGSNPNNYVLFNDESWRIIGVFNTKECIEGATQESQCTSQNLVKIIKTDSIGQYSWDSSPESINKGEGINEWSTSNIQKILNNYYLSGSSGECYSGKNQTTTQCDFESKGLSPLSLSMISNSLYNTGTMATGWNLTTSKNVLSSEMYQFEHSENSGKAACATNYCDSTTHTTKWIGKVGLIYPSDYGYSTIKTCQKISLYNYDTNNCFSNSWIYSTTNELWTITPTAWSNASHIVFAINKGGKLNSHTSIDKLNTYPVVYLKSSVKIIGGKGTEQEPYELSL